MRILAIGLGGAGTRIVDQLYDHDTRSRVGCVNALAVDMDGNSLRQLEFIPQPQRMNFPPLDPDIHFDVPSTVNVEEIMTMIQRMDTVEIDAIMIFAGLGGSVIDAVPELVEELRIAYIEPVFGVCTLPMRHEGKKQSSKASEDIIMLRDVLDAVILFDNETWYGKLQAEFHEHSVAMEEKRLPYPAKKFPENPRDLYRMLNDRIARQIGLLLRAGEFNEEGLEAAEVVLDAGEVLNTLRDNGLVAIGYAVEPLTVSLKERFLNWRSETYFSEYSHKRATRIVSLAKKAVYEDISVPCDITSADKALVLIAGPSQELSMKGFQTVRKWIDRSISGLEMRSGDYPVRNTKYVGIIIVLSGIENIPRVTELADIKKEYEAERLEEEEEIKRREEMQAWEAEEESWVTARNPDTGDYRNSGETTGGISFIDLLEDDDECMPPEISGEGEEEAVLNDEDGRPVTSREYVEYSQDYDTDYGSKGDDGDVKDEMVRLEGIAATKDSTDDSLTAKDGQITIAGAGRQESSDDKLVLPGRQARTVADMTRMTSGGSNNAPNDAIFGLKEIPKRGQKGPRDTSLVGSSIAIDTPGFRAKDSTFEGGKVSVASAAGPNDSSINGSSVKVRPVNTRLNDSVVSGNSVQLSGSKIQTKELLDGEVRMKEKIPAPKDELMARVETRMKKTKEQTAQPQKEPSYKAGTISSTYTKKNSQEEEEEEKADDLFWIT
ncbi:tubulin/FtsZ family protein [Methanovulcanius yangii]|uniref:tubulin/FtsZ family protein n=1 Tax=Methanovulcanius yangii TaxID=1789227 RepID=UPI0029CA4779|nr:tubulin/FtsZ family protein [Methanovulcanius yangii]